ncbi:uncharacterized protein LOC101855375 [Aplysia californica]|uniref:Uncharacterized protein LOC101855375 n=1 Tax=Aplysia californica TaxID=6500 RepID=A0ABM1W195_APLCA|nr:uncharacterized protein LOC101855375 [Aplysia californica]
MSTVAYLPVGGLEDLEKGLNRLRRSQLMIVPEFKSMFWAMERHHRDLKLAHLTGKAKDLQEQAIRDTKFYNILVKMLCEVKEKRTGEQREGLRRVHTWYMANKHVLYCGPRFGKEVLKEEAKDVLVKATTPRQPKRAKSAKERPSSSRVKVTPSRSGRFSTPRQGYSGGRQKLYNSFQSTPRMNGGHESFRLDFVPRYVNEPYDPPPYSQEENEFAFGLQFAGDGDELVAVSNENLHLNLEQDIMEEPAVESAVSSPHRVLSRPKTASVSFSPLKEQSVNQAKPESPFGKRPVHPISSMVNPHVTLAKELAPVNQEELDEKKAAMPIRIGSAHASRSENLQAWQTFNKNRSYGQEIAGKLSFVGRSGTASDVRYAAHNRGEMPEIYTQDVVKHFSQHISPTSVSPRGSDEEAQAYMNQTLEDFYQQADGMVPPTRIRSKSAKYARIKSAPPKVHNAPGSGHTPAVVTSKQSEETVRPVPEEKPVVGLSDTGVKLDTVITVIDSVTDDMAYFKEKLAPEPEPGFRQPSTAGLPTPREATASMTPRTLMEVEGSEHPVCPTPVPNAASEDPVSRPFSSPMASHMVHIRDDTPDGRRRGKVRCQSASVVDWRGKIVPDTMRYKWSKTKFGGHTYLKKWYRPNLRSAGSTSGGKRPKTAPITAKEKWKTQKESDKNERAVQAASHSTMVVNQEDVDHMITVQHLLSGEDRADSLGSLLDFDENFWKSLRGSPSKQEANPSLEFLSIITPSAAALAEQQKAEAAKAEGSPADPIDPNQQPSHESGVPSSVLPAEIHVPHSDFDEEALNAAVREEQCLRSELSPSPTAGDHRPDQGFVSQLQARPKSQGDHPDSHIEVSSAVVPGGRSPTPAHLRAIPLQQLSQSEPWQFSLEEEFHDPEESKKTDHFSDVQLIPEQSCPECRSAIMSTRVERSAGRMPSRSQSANTQMLAFSRRYNEAMRRAPPLRTPPSIPTPQPSAKKTSRRSGQILFELEHQARKTRSPRNFMQKIQDLRSVDTSRPGSLASTMTPDPIVGMSLHVCKLPVSSRGRTSQISSDMDFELQTPKYLSDAPYFMSREQSSLQAIDEGLDQFRSDHVVSFSDLQHPQSKPMTAPAMAGRNSLPLPEELSLQRNATFTSIGSRQTGRSGVVDGQSGPPPTRNIARIGRPIAQVSQVPDPDELLQAVQVQKEAAAAVDIQRIFRGYVARSVYKNLLSEERQKNEDERKAAVKIQSLYRGHVSRKSAIYNRPPLNPELIQWARDFKAIQSHHAIKRQVKMENLSNEISSNHREANGKISVIGPHVEIYDIYHPKKTGPTKRELNTAAIKIQKIARGWMIRRKMEKLARKATWYGSSFPKMVKEYKTMLKQVQQQHGVDKAKTPFSIKDMNDYIDIRRRYESVFEKKSFGGELEQGDVEAFFKECDLYPSQAEIEEAMDVTMHGQANKRGNQGMKKKELMDMIFYIYVPPATGLKNTRQSTWMNPIINGQEARKLLGSEFVEQAPLAPCVKLVIDLKREERQKEQALKEAEARKRIEETWMKKAEEKKDGKRSRKVTYQEPEEG